MEASAPPTPPATEGAAVTTLPMSDKARRSALYVLCAGVLMIVLDATIVNVALPAIQEDLGFTPSSLAWVVNAYLIAFGGFLLLAGRLGDLAGRRSIFLSGLFVFTIASALCGLAQNEAMLIGARFLQGIGGALTSAVVLGMIVTLFPEPKEQAKAIGVYAFVASAGGAIGLLAGGFLTESINWHWIFFVNIPIGIATAIATRKLVQNDTGIGFANGTDVAGAFLITSALGLGAYTIVKPATEYGWTDTETLIFGAVSIALLAGFVIREATAAHPLMPLSIFKSRSVVGANIIQSLGAAAMFGSFFMGALYLQGILRYDALQTGLAFLPTTIFMGVLSVKYSERLITRFGPFALTVVGFLVMATGFAWFTQAPVDGNYALHVFPVTAMLGIGAGLAFPALMGLAMTGVKPHEAGLASGLINTTAQVGGALGLAVLASFSASRSEDLIASGRVQDVALNSGYHLAYAMATVFLLVSVAVAATLLRPRTPGARNTVAPDSDPTPELEYA